MARFPESDTPGCYFFIGVCYTLNNFYALPPPGLLMASQLRSKQTFDTLISAALPVIAVAGALVVGALLLSMLGVDPLQAYGALLECAAGHPAWAR